MNLGRSRENSRGINGSDGLDDLVSYVEDPPGVQRASKGTFGQVGGWLRGPNCANINPSCVLGCSNVRFEPFLSHGGGF